MVGTLIAIALNIAMAIFYGVQGSKTKKYRKQIEKEYTMSLDHKILLMKTLNKLAADSREIMRNAPLKIQVDCELLWKQVDKVIDRIAEELKTLDEETK